MPNAPFTKSGETIVQDFAASAQAVSEKPLNFNIGKVFRALAEASAGVSDWLQKLYLFALLISRLQTSRGQWVDTFCADFMPAVLGSDSPRLPASPADGTLTFSRSTPQSQAIIPVGSLATTFDGSQVFQVLADASNQAYSANIIPGGGYVVAAGVPSISVPATALSIGSVGNVSAGTITLLRSPLVGIDSVVNSSDFAGGLDAETDDALKARFKQFILSLRAGTIDAIEYAVTSLRQGLQVKVHDGYLPDGSVSHGAMTIYIDDGSGAPGSGLVSLAASAIEAVRAGGTRPNVLGATTLQAYASMTIAVGPGYYKPTVVAAVANSIGAYIGSLGLEQCLPFTLLEHLAYSASPGVTNVTNVTLNGTTADLVPGFGQTIKVGGPGIVVN